MNQWPIQFRLLTIAALSATSWTGLIAFVWALVRLCSIGGA